MVTVADVKAELAQLIERMTKGQLVELLDEARWLLEEEHMTEEERREIEEGFAELERGDSISLDKLRQKLGD